MSDQAPARHALRYDALLLLAAAIWGFAFVAQRAGMEHVGPFVFNGIRFALGALVLVPILLHGRRTAALRAKRSTREVGARPKRPLLRGGLAAGLVLFAGASLQQMGLVSTTAGKAGFITGLYVVLVPLLGVLFLRQRIGFYNVAAALLAAGGLYLLSMSERLAIGSGDSLVLAGAFAWAVHVLVIARFAVRVDPLRLAFTQFAICAGLSLLTAAAVETIPSAGLRAAAVSILYGGLLSVGVAYTLQVVAQRYAHPAPAAILLSLEAAFAALGGAVVLGESLSSRELAGCAVMLGGVLLSQARRRERGEARAEP